VYAGLVELQRARRGAVRAAAARDEHAEGVVHLGHARGRARGDESGGRTGRIGRHAEGRDAAEQDRASAARPRARDEGGGLAAREHGTCVVEELDRDRGLAALGDVDRRGRAIVAERHGLARGGLVGRAHADLRGAREGVGAEGGAEVEGEGGAIGAGEEEERTGDRRQATGGGRRATDAWEAGHLFALADE